MRAHSGPACCRCHSHAIRGPALAPAAVVGPQRPVLAAAAASAAAAAARAPLTVVAAATQQQQQPKLAFDPLALHRRRRQQQQQQKRAVRCRAAEAGAPIEANLDTSALPESFCIIESRDAVKDFASLQLDEITDAIALRRNRIFLLMEEVRRLRIQQRLKGGDDAAGAAAAAALSAGGGGVNGGTAADEPYRSALPFLPPLTDKTLRVYYSLYFAFVAGVISFGALLAPLLEVKIGLGGTSYLDFVTSVRLPPQLAAVDPIVASFCGGAVGAVSALLVVEVNNVKAQQRGRCHYCEGTGYLPCGHCVGSGVDPQTRAPCAYCAGTSKVMCTGCLCTGKTMATEHDPRIDPFD